MKNLEGKHAVVFGAGGSVGAAVAKEFAAEGAELFLAGRTKPNVEAVMMQITKDGGRAQSAVIDAEDYAISMKSRGRPGASISYSMQSGHRRTNTETEKTLWM